MKNLPVLVYSALMGILSSCSNAGTQEQPIATSQAKADSTQSTTITSDSLALTTLIRQLYQWHETPTAPETDFSPQKINPADSLYKGIDWTAHQAALKRLKNSGLFDQEFLDNYQQVAQYIDSILKNGIAIWPEGELPTFGEEADPWCRCQDIPDGQYWERITLDSLQVNRNEADFKWTLPEGYRYAVRAKKAAGSWKISYLEGFDRGRFAPHQ